MNVLGYKLHEDTPFSLLKSKSTRAKPLAEVMLKWLRHGPDSAGDYPD